MVHTGAYAGAQLLGPDLAPDYVLVGHATRDVDQFGERPGGSVVYAGVTARRLGKRVGIVSAHAPEAQMPRELARAAICRSRSQRTTCFVHEMDQGERVLRLLERAADIPREAVPASWLRAEIVHLAPVAGEIPPSAPRWFRSTWIAATLQGWLRSWDPDGHVELAPERLESLPLDGTSAVVLSIEDVAGQTNLVDRLACRVPIVVLTRGAAGSTLYVDGTATHIPPVPARVVETTGAGDVFATAFFIALRANGDPFGSAHFASGAAALSVERIGASSAPTTAEIERVLCAGA
ncbi:MAG: ribokinase [Chloroflexi bacterium]|nr:ribokinase [Chloroflexota bacterium]